MSTSRRLFLASAPIAALLVRRASPPDPIHAAIAAHRAAFEAFVATVDPAHARHRTQADEDAYQAALAAERAAFAAFVATTPNTLAGVRAMLAYAVEVDVGCLPETGGKIGAALLRSPALA